MRLFQLFQAPLDTCLGSPFFASLSVHGLPFTVYAASRCGVDAEIPYRLAFWREFCWVLQVRVASGVNTEFPYRVRIADRGVDCRDPVCRHRFRFPEGQLSAEARR